MNSSNYFLHIICVPVALSDMYDFIVDFEHPLGEIFDEGLQFLAFAKEEYAPLSIPPGSWADSSDVNFKMLQLVRVVPIADDLDIWEEFLQHLPEFIELRCEILNKIVNSFQGSTYSSCQVVVL